jgi:putative addiction module killer protein
LFIGTLFQAWLAIEGLSRESIKINLIIDDLYLVGYIIIMAYTIETTKQYDKWFKKLKDALMKIKVLARLSRVENGNFGDSKQLSDSLFELRFFFGSGIRIYYTIKEGKIVLLLVGGDKSSQQKDIDKAEVLLKKMED